MKRHFQAMIPFETHSRKNLPRLAILKNFKNFFQKTHLFFQKTQILNVLRILSFPVAFYGKFATIQWKKIHVQTREPTSFLARAQLANIG